MTAIQEKCFLLIIGQYGGSALDANATKLGGFAKTYMAMRDAAREELLARGLIEGWSPSPELRLRYFITDAGRSRLAELMEAEA